MGLSLLQAMPGELPSISTGEHPSPVRIPKTIHFCFGMAEDFGGIPFSFVHYLSVLLARHVASPDRILWHYKFPPSGKWWEACRALVELMPCEPPREVFNRPIKHPAHMADIVRLKVLEEFGGIYLDADVWLLREPTALQTCECVLGLQEGTYGLCNAVIMAAPQARFIKQWIEEYRDFDCEQWDEHSVKRPMRIATEHPDLLNVQPENVFFWPSWQNPDAVFFDTDKEFVVRRAKGIARSHGSLRSKMEKVARLYFGHDSVRAHASSRSENLEKLRTSYAVHLWESKWWHPFLEGINPDWVVNSRTALAVRLREVLGEDLLETVQGI